MYSCLKAAITRIGIKYGEVMENLKEMGLVELTPHQTLLSDGGIIVARFRWIWKAVEFIGLLDAAEEFGEGFMECATN